MSLARYLQHVQGGDGFSPHIFDEHFAKYANEGYAAPVEPTAEAVPPPVPYGDITARQAEDFGVVMVDRDVLARIMRAVEEVERRKGLSVPPSLNSVYASEGGGWPGVTTEDGELVRMPSRLDLDYGTKMPPMMLPSDFERVMAPIYPGFRPVHGAGDSGGNERSEDAPKPAAGTSTSSTAVGTGHDLSAGASSSAGGAGSSAAGSDTDETVAKGVEFIDGVLEINGDEFFRGIASDDRRYILTKGGKAVPAKVASWVRESVGSCASGVGKTLKRDEMARVVAAMYPDLPAEFLQKAAKPSLCLLLGDEIVGRTISGLCRQGLAGGPDTQRRLIEIVSTLTQQPAASLVALSREALCSLAANASSTKQRAGAMHAAKLLDPLAGVDWSKVGAQASSALSAAARGGRAAFDASKVIGEQLYDGTNAVLQSPVTRAAARMAGQAAMAGGRMAGQAAMAGGRMGGGRRWTWWRLRRSRSTG
eukprot:jgi/Mesvir1/16993/Mv19369-RA.1